MLFALHLLALCVGGVIFAGMIVLHRRARSVNRSAPAAGRLTSAGLRFAHHPSLWLAIHSSNPRAVEAALGLSNAAPCPESDDTAGGHDFFIRAPVNDWIVVTGSGLPHPGIDVDRCFHFLIRLSRVAGEVQFFLADPLLHHHAWARVENGAVKRAYAWINETVWNQGVKSIAEIELNMKCFSYGEDAGMDDATTVGYAAANVEQIHALSARWSLDPSAADGNLQTPPGGIARRSVRPW